MTDYPTADSDAISRRRLDGNALAGALSDIFAVDVLLARTTCRNCRRASTMAETDGYADAPAMVLRCRGCGAVLMRFGYLGPTWHLDLSGTQLLVGEASA